jgi:hypothetical protein
MDRGLMKIFVGFDDTDSLGGEIGTGLLARRFGQTKLPPGVRLWGVLRQQLRLDARIPFTSQNSAACVVVEAAPSLIAEITERALAHIAEVASPTAAPGLCVASEEMDLAPLIEFGLACTHEVATLERAKEVAARAGAHVSGAIGVIGAVAAVGLTAHGWSGRFIEFGDLRALPDPIRVEVLIGHGIMPTPIDRATRALAPDTLIHCGGWLSPRLWAGRPVAPVEVKYGRYIALGARPRDAETAE